MRKTNGIDVWMFGGSTVYGTGVPDFATLPSFVSRELNSEALGCVAVTNFRTEGYVTNQELILLMEQLKAGHRPNVVIFYDGANDADAGAVSPGVPDAHMAFSDIKARVEGSFAAGSTFFGILTHCGWLDWSYIPFADRALRHHKPLKSSQKLRRRSIITKPICV